MFQARVLRQWTDRFLRAGGLRPGMSVLDLGSGLGDTALLAAEIVGPSGSVLGIDRDQRVTDKARGRVAEEGLSQTVRFEVADVGEFRPAGTFDALIGRYVLLYQQDPAAVLRHYSRFLRPGGLVIFHEFDLVSIAASSPAYPARCTCQPSTGPGPASRKGLPGGSRTSQSDYHVQQTSMNTVIVWTDNKGPGRGASPP